MPSQFFYIDVLLISLLSIGDKFVPMAPYVPGRAAALTSRVQDEPIPKTVEELNNLNPFVDMVIWFSSQALS